MSQDTSARQASSSASQDKLSTAEASDVLGQNSKLLEDKQLTEAQALPVGDLHCSAMSPAAETVEEIPEKTFDDLFIELRDRVPCIKGDDSASRVYILKQIISYIDNLRLENLVLGHNAVEWGNEGEWGEEWDEECGEWEEREWLGECEEEGDYEEQGEAGWEEGEWEEQGEAGWEGEVAEWEEQGPEWEEQGPEWEEQGPEWEEQGPEWEEQGPEWEEQGPEWEEQGPEWEEQGGDWEIQLEEKGAQEEGG